MCAPLLLVGLSWYQAVLLPLKSPPMIRFCACVIWCRGGVYPLGTLGPVGGMYMLMRLACLLLCPVLILKDCSSIVLSCCGSSAFVVWVVLM